MLAKGYSIADISDITGLSLKAVKQLKKDKFRLYL